MKTSIPVLVFFLLLPGCTAATPSATPASPTSVPTPSPTLTASSAPAIPPDARLSIQCLDILPTIPSDLKTSGVFVLKSENSMNDYLRNAATGVTITLYPVTSGAWVTFVSPDRKWLAYEESYPHFDSLVIADARGRISHLINI